MIRKMAVTMTTLALVFLARCAQSSQSAIDAAVQGTLTAQSAIDTAVAQTLAAIPTANPAPTRSPLL